MDSNTRLSALRDTLHAPPGPETFEALAACFDGWTDDSLSVGLDYAEEKLESWPERFRRPPKAVAAAIVESKGELPEWWPLVRRARLEGIKSNALKGLLKGKAFAHLTWLKTSAIGVGTEKRLLSSNQLKNIRVLRLAGLDTAGARVLAQSKHLRKLAVLDLQMSKVRSAGLVALLKNKALCKGLRRLNVDSAGIRVSGAEALAKSPLVGDLESLCIGEFSGGRRDENPRMFEALCSSETLTGLRELCLLERYVPPGGLTPLFEPTNRLRLTHLNLGGTMVNDEDLGRIAAAAPLGDLRWLNVSEGHTSAGQKRFTNDGVEALAASKQLTNLQALFISGSRSHGESYQHGVGPSGVKALCGAGFAPNLVQLDLHENPLGDAGLDILARSGRFDRLEHLSLAFTRFTERGFLDFLHTARLPALKHLVLGIGDLASHREAIERSPLADAILGTPPRQTNAGVSLWRRRPLPDEAEWLPEAVPERF